MSYCRFIEADVYAYESRAGWVIHVTGRSDLLHAGERFLDSTLEDFQTRMIMLRDLGYYIPDYVFEDIANEIVQDAALKQHAGDDAGGK